MCICIIFKVTEINYVYKKVLQSKNNVLHENDLLIYNTGVNGNSIFFTVEYNHSGQASYISNIFSISLVIIQFSGKHI